MPAITVKSIAGQSSVYLLPATSPQFKKAVMDEPPAFEYVRRMAALHPHSVVLMNQSDKDVWAYAVRWSGKDPAGKDISIPRDESGFNAGFPDTSLFPRGLLQASSTRVVVPLIHPLFITPGPWSWDDKKFKAMNDLLSYLRRFADMTITLDAVLFADGLAIGDDPEGRIFRWKAALEAGNEVARVMASGNVATVRSGLEAVVEAGRKETEDTSTMFFAPLSAASYETVFRALRSHVAQTQLVFMRMGSLDLEQFRLANNNRAFPSIHR